MKQQLNTKTGNRCLALKIIITCYVKGLTGGGGGGGGGLCIEFLFLKLLSDVH